MSNILNLYHGTRVSFQSFNPTFFKTGESIGDYNGWYFCSTPKGALAHCKTYLNCNIYKGEGYVLHCQVDRMYVDEEIDGILADPCYGPAIYGVPLKNSGKIKIMNAINAKDVFESIYGVIQGEII